MIPCMCKLNIILTASLAMVFLSGTLAQTQNTPEQISVKGKNFENSSGEIVLFHGLNIKDPHNLEQEGKWTKAHFETAENWGADMIRLPVHPNAWRERGEENYLQLLDQAVQWARELGLYLVIDWHSIGNLGTGKFQNRSYNTTLQETNKFWATISKHFSGEPVIAMYELFNEPTIGGQFGDLTWAAWKKMNEEMIDIIRSNDPETVILVAGFNWAYDLTPVKSDPIDRSNVAYVSHPYPEKRKQPWVQQWQEDWGFVAEKYPVILTEIGFALPHEPGVHIPVNGDETYGNALVDFCEERGISWLGWCFDSRWSPVMYTGDYEPTRQGAFFRSVMLRD